METNAEQKPKKKKIKVNNWLVPLAIVISGFLIGGAILVSNLYGSINSAQTGNNQDNSQPPPVVNVSEDDDPFLGSENAPVTLIEFSDFQCPFCRRFWTETLSQLKQEYIDTGKVKFIYRDFPLTNIHPAATVAAESSQCANDQDKFWEFHDKIFEEQNKQGGGTINFSRDNLENWAQQIGLNTQELNQCLDSEKYRDEVEKDYRDGLNAGVTGTPTVFINGRRVVGALPYSTFKALIEEELNK